MSKCRLRAPQLDHLQESNYEELSNIACTSFLAAETAEYQYEGSIKNLLYLVKFSLEMEDAHTSSWYKVCRKILDTYPDQNLTPYKEDIDTTLTLIEKGCRKTVAFICKSQIKNLTYQVLDARDTNEEHKQEIKDYIENSICGQNNDEDVDAMLFSV